ncbi:hypothetical protein SLA2020_516490 [Shorea laevis]
MEMELGKLFIGGISWDTNEDRLREYFQTFGEVLEAVVMKDRATGRARGFGFVIFADPAVAERVVLEKHLIDGKTVEAKKAIPRDDQNILNKNNSSIHGSSSPARTKKIFVGGLASSVTESDFKNYFDQFGTITDVVVMYDHNTQRPRGFGFITYDSEEAVDKVLQKTFHELNGKMVEVKRAVPKELSPGPNRNQLGGYNYGLSRFSSFLNGYIQGYNPSLLGGYGVRMDGRYSPVSVGRSGFPSLSPGYGMGLNFESNLSPSYGGSANLSSSIGYGQGLNTSYSHGNSNRYGGSFGSGGGPGANSSILSSNGRNLWGNGGLNYAANSMNSGALVGSGSGNSGMGSFGSFGSLWASSPPSGQGGVAASAYGSSNLGFVNGDFGVGYGRNNRTSIVQAPSRSASNGSYDGSYENGSFYGDTTWRSSTSDLEHSGSFDFGLEKADSDVLTTNSAGYIGSYSITNRQPNRDTPYVQELLHRRRVWMSEG